MTRRPTLLTPLLALSLCAPALLAAQATRLPAPAQVRRVADSLASAFIARNDAPGIAVAVVRGTDTLLFRGYGTANLELAVPVNATSVFRIGSVTKQFTAAAVLQLVEVGKLALTDSIGQWVPDLPAAWRPITITQLLNHTSGIPSYTDAGEAWAKRWGEEMTGAQIVAITADKPFDFAPGTSWKYNNTGYVLLGMLLEARMGQGWGDELARRFFTPLGMTRTQFCDTKPVIAGRASGYGRNDKGVWGNSTYLAMSQPHAAGALCSTIGDLLTWNRALHGGKILKPATYAAMTTPTGAAMARRYGFALGRDTASIPGTVILTHNGGIPGFLTSNMVVPAANLSVTVLTNGEVTNPDDMAMQLTRAALGAPLKLPPKGIALTAAQLGAYTGNYSLVLDAPRPFTVLMENGKLAGRLEGQSASPLIPLGGDTFGVDFDPDVRVTFAVTGGKATGFTLKQGGKDFTATRVP